MKHSLVAALALGVILVLPAGASGQTGGTNEGIAAFVRGDYATAVEILRPAAERWQMPFDNTAAFFMAMMYDNGLGVAPDPVRACALMLRTTVFGASVSRALTFAAQTLAMDFNSRLAPEQMAQCMLLTDIGFDRTVQRATFTIAAGHWISVEFSSERREAVAHLEYGGKQRDLELPGPNMAGVRYLPFTVTELTSLRPRPAPRHFLEAFVFMPAQVNRWALMWFVFEIVRDTLVEVTVEDLQTVDGEQPPHYELTDLRHLAEVLVNADGDAEWVVRSGPEPRSDVIETDAERQEAATEKRASEAADKAVDWTVRRPIDRRPALTYSASSNAGCMGPVAYGWSSDRTEAIMLRVDPDAFRSDGSGATFAIGQNAGVEIAAHVYEAPQRSWPFCSHTRMTGDEGERWRAIAGTVVIELTPVFRVREPETYRATIRLTGAEFISATGTRVRQSQPIALSTLVRLPQQ